MFMNKDSMRSSFGRHVSMILVLAMLLTTVFTGCGSDAKETAPAETPAETAAEVINLMEEPAKSEIVTLMKSYFKALKKGDVDALGEIMVNAPSKQTVEREIEYIEGYKNVKCYTQPGHEDNTYVTYVYYDVKFKNIETYAPSMIREYICTNEEGNLYINNGTVDGDVAAWLDTVHNSDAVNELLADVNAKLIKAASGDEKLNALVNQLGAGVEETIAPETAETVDVTAESENNAADKTEEASAEDTTEEAVKETHATETTKEETTEEETTVEETKKASKKDYDAFKKAKTLYTKDITNVRKSASSSSKLLGRLNEGKKVKALGTKDGWYVIKYGSKKGYIKKGLLTSKKPKTEITFKSKDDKVEALQNVKMRKKPSETAKSIGTLPGGTKVTRTGYNKKWTRIVYKGKTVYVASKYVEKVN